MYKLKPKTQEEIDGLAIDTQITQREYNEKYYQGSRDTFWHCENCKVLFEDDDFLIERIHKKKHEALCPRTHVIWIKNWFKPTRVVSSPPCMTRLTYADMDYWNKNYHLSNHNL